MAHHHNRSSKSRSDKGATSGKYPVVLNNGKTIIYISDKSREAEVRAKYEMIRLIE